LPNPEDAHTPASAQPVIQEPGYCAFFYPTANCQNKGPGNPYTDPNWRRDGGGWSTGQWSSGETVGVAEAAPADAIRPDNVSLMLTEAVIRARG
jgi:hypothetical protein